MQEDVLFLHTISPFQVSRGYLINKYVLYLRAYKLHQIVQRNILSLLLRLERNYVLRFDYKSMLSPHFRGLLEH